MHCDPTLQPRTASLRSRCLSLREAAGDADPKDNVPAPLKTHENRLLAGETGCLGPGPVGGRNLLPAPGGVEVWRQP